MLRVLSGEDDPVRINNTFIVLIPKVKSPEELGQFRPISLCNVIYKITSKVLANRLKMLLPNIISEEQSAFVPGRLITDNIIAAYECLHFMKQKRSSDQRYCALKLDMKKAYDRVEWNYLRAIMLKLGFHQLWVDMIMRLVSSVSFAVLFNGECLETFNPSRGIRQGDPISPYLFVLAAEGHSCLLKSRIQSSALKGIMVHRRHRWLVTYSLRMTACCFSKRTWRIQWRSEMFCKLTVEHLVNRSTWRNPRSILQKDVDRKPGMR